ncbi:MAG: tRNA (guanine(10)-N(2))-dimethyltransferase, partial [Candidatus Woesearchaeota archaeon]
INIKKNLDLNNIKSKIIISNTEASKFLLESTGFDYIDIDPFGYPGPFLDAACKRISRDGIIAVTATDTAALSGTFPSACKRKYWAKPLRNDMMHETGLRILARRVQLIGASYEKALLPIFSHATEHYMRIYFHVQKSNKAIKEIFENFGKLTFCPSCLARTHEAKVPCNCNKTLDFAGELWLGRLWNKDLASKMAKNNKQKENQKFLNTIAEESKVNIPYIYDLHSITKKYKLRLIKKEEIIKKLKSASSTHICPTAIRTTSSLKEIIKTMEQLK